MSAELYPLQGGLSSKLGATEACARGYDAGPMYNVRMLHGLFSQDDASAQGAPPLMVPWDRSKKEKSNQAKI
jgi:hypothetical protein